MKFGIRIGVVARLMSIFLNILTIFWSRINSPHPPNLLFFMSGGPTFLSWGFNIAQVTPPVKLCKQA